MKKALIIATTSQSLVLQSPSAWEVLIERGYQLTFVSRADEWATELARWGEFVPVHASRTPRSLRTHVAFARSLRSIVRSQRWDFIQIQTPIASALARTVARLPRTIPTLYVAHGFHFHRDQSARERAPYLAIERLLASRTRAIAVVSEEDFADATDLGFGRRTTLWHLPGAGVSIDEGQTVELSDGEVLPGSPCVIFCGELIERKNPLLLVEAIDLLSREGSDVGLLMIGSGPLRDQVLERARGIQAAGRFKYIERTRNVPALMKHANLHVMSSWQEGVPRVAMEAAASGTPTLAISNRGSRELASRGLARLASRNSTVREFADAISNCLSEPVPVDLRERSEWYSVPKFNESYRRLLDTIGA